MDVTPLTATAHAQDAVHLELTPEQIAFSPPSVSATLNARGSKYGPFEDQALIEQSLKSAFRTGNWDRLLPDQKSALEMIAVKASRILTGDPDYADNWHDMAGYATLVDQRLTAEQHG